MPQGANSLFFTLIPNVSNPIHINDLHPISLIGVHYKIIAKILATRLSKVIDKIVSKEQSAFIVGRQILNGPLNLSEIIDWFKNRKKKMLIFKVDFEKAFDSVTCLHSARASILINGSPISEFSIKHGLRQGDPLSPFLFILVMEGLHCAISNAFNSSLIRGIKLSSSNITISHLFYADELRVSKIIIHKSNIYGIGVPNDEVADMARRTGCASSSFPFTYLGLPIGSNMNLNSSWQILINRFHKRLSSWKANLLSIGGRLTLIKAVLGSLGLNIGSLKSFNLALLRKLRWRMFSFPNAFWVKFIKSLHGQCNTPKYAAAEW
ncbi:putative RNA-directed DNA polymerase, eukaryota, reverse transcriptase zinc-binding domain protein [Tanacetum coccineum]